MEMQYFRKEDGWLADSRQFFVIEITQIPDCAPEDMLICLSFTLAIAIDPFLLVERHCVMI